MNQSKLTDLTVERIFLFSTPWGRMSIKNRKNSDIFFSVYDWMMPCAYIEAYNKLVIYFVFTRHAYKIDSKYIQMSGADEKKVFFQE